MRTRSVYSMRSAGPRRVQHLDHLVAPAHELHGEEREHMSHSSRPIAFGDAAVEAVADEQRPDQRGAGVDARRTAADADAAPTGTRRTSRRTLERPAPRRIGGRSARSTSGSPRSGGRALDAGEQLGRGRDEPGAGADAASTIAPPRPPVTSVIRTPVDFGIAARVAVPPARPSSGQPPGRGLDRRIEVAATPDQCRRARASWARSGPVSSSR